MPSPLERARRALAEADWEGAKREFVAASASGNDAAAHEGLGFALWWLGDVAEALRVWETSYVEYTEAGDKQSAARLALILAREVGSFGHVAASSGWDSRAERILAELPACSERVDAILRSARRETDTSRATERFEEALSMARAIGDRAREIVVLSAYGRMLVCIGRVEEGFVRLDEAMAETTSGVVKDHFLAADASCNMLVACERAHDLQRAAEWSRLTEDWARRYGCRPIFAFCRVIYGGVLFARGRWADAEDEIVDAMRRYEESFPGSPMVAGAAGRLAELRVAQGQLEDAGALLDPFYEHPSCAYAAAALERARGDLDVAASRLERRAGAVEHDLCLLAPLSEALVEVHLARDDGKAAEHHGARLASIAKKHPSRTLHAMADASLGALAAHKREPDAVTHFSRALDAYVELSMPYRAARTQLALAKTIASNRRDAALAAARAAHSAFEKLGAAPGVEDAASLVRSLSGARPTLRKRIGAETLTKREAQVLDLLAEGLSNPEIAVRLEISAKTAEHHVCSILAKLDLKSRAAAAAHAARSPRK